MVDDPGRAAADRLVKSHHSVGNCSRYTFIFSHTTHQIVVLTRDRLGRRSRRLSWRGRLTVFSPIRLSRAWSQCLAPGLGLAQELVALPETVPVEMLSQTIGEPVLVASPGP